MSNRRNFLLLMGGTTSSIVLANVGKGVFNPVLAQGACKIDNEATKEAVKGGIKVLENVAQATNTLQSQFRSASGAEIANLSAKIEESVDASTAFWSNAENVELFIRGAAANAQTSLANAVKSRFSSKQIDAALKESLKNLKAKNLSAIESDPIIGPIVKAGYNAASIKLKQAAALRNANKAARKELRDKISDWAENQAVKLKKESKLTDNELQQLSTNYRSLAPKLKKAIDNKDKPGTGVQSPQPGQVKPNSNSIKPVDRAVGASTATPNKFDVYAEIFDRRLLAMDAPIKERGNLTIFDRILGIEPANAELITAAVILGAVVVAGVVAVAGVATASDAIKNDACKELLLKQDGDKVAACEKRAAKRRKDRLKQAKRGLKACQSNPFGIFCGIGNHFVNDDIEADFEREVDKCS